MRILIVEDEKDLANFIANSLKRKGFAIDLAYEGERGSFLARTNSYDLIITDYVLPKLDGLSLIEEVRRDGVNIPILMLSVRHSLEDKVQVLGAGADDYLTKPFINEELIARVEALLRRQPHLNKEELKFNDVKLESSSFSAWRGNKKLKLTNKEFSLLQYFLLHPQEIITRNQLLEHVWSEDTDPFSNTVETHIMRLRQKLENYGERIIHNIIGRGYKLDKRP